ncbi:Long chronological lifespan protein [Lachnellula hyalina]|uniref:Long chronological lifespan protein 2 n=1 Tax=Lachnellula hyalina TaxID=1316788 RepID=A0A8H8QWL8_9HELO|nr:Long chronological lifespan protein [Lachnellula hyalina]TVY23055.1 Long chronological lifespan protein [Lachnellula hyalina]
MARITMLPLLATLLLISSVSAQFDFFNMFNNGQQNQAQHRQDPQNVPSDSAWYQQNYDAARCTNYLCPDTLACVHFPHHCPCPHPAVEEKFELGEGRAVCVSKGGFKEGEAGRKIELARKGLI